MRADDDGKGERDVSDWLELRVVADIAAVETVTTILAEYGEGGVAIEQPVLSDSEGERYGLDTSKPATVTTYVPLDDHALARQAAIDTALGHMRPFELAFIGPLEARTVRDEDWAEAWKQHYHPLRVGRRLVIKPTWRPYDGVSDDVIIELDPGMAFGTGSHQTTAMCLAWLEDLVTAGMMVLDQGTGSGILAIAAALLGAAQIDAVDISSVAVSTTTTNVAQNNLSEHIKVARVDDTADAGWPGGDHQYDLIIANIIARVLIALAPSLARVLKPGAVILASGIIAERAHEVRAAFGAVGLRVEEERAQDEWVTLLARRDR